MSFINEYKVFISRTVGAISNRPQYARNREVISKAMIRAIENRPYTQRIISMNIKRLYFATVGAHTSPSL